jgi:hypothetical protein
MCIAQLNDDSNAPIVAMIGSNGEDFIEYNEVDVLNMSDDAVEILKAYYLVVVKGVSNWGEYNQQLPSVDIYDLRSWYINCVSMCEQHENIEYQFGAFMYCVLNPTYDANCHFPSEAERIATEAVFYYCWEEKDEFVDYFVEENM